MPTSSGFVIFHHLGLRLVNYFSFSFGLEFHNSSKFSPFGKSQAKRFEDSIMEEELTEKKNCQTLELYASVMCVNLYFCLFDSNKI